MNCLMERVPNKILHLLIFLQMNCLNERVPNEILRLFIFYVIRKITYEL